MPARYGSAAIGIAEAALHALAAVPAGRGSGRPEMPRLHADHPMFFTFQIRAANGEAPVPGAVSGRLVNVDKCDGHVWSAEEMSEYFARIGPR